MSLFDSSLPESRATESHNDWTTTTGSPHLTGTLTYFGSPSPRGKARIIADHAQQRLDFAVHKQILWDSETATTSEVLAMERKLIVETGANNPEVGYNLAPRWTGTALS